MPDLVLMDNDILFKVSCLDLIDGFQALYREKPIPCRLGMAAYVLPKKLARSAKLKDKVTSSERLASIMRWAPIIEPTPDEVAFAADIETVAQENNISFDSGESLLLSILIRRSARSLVTGDKRAVVGLSELGRRIQLEDAITGCVICFEQVLLRLLGQMGARELTQRVCREPDVDLATSMCCGCASGGADEENLTAGVESYINDLRSKSGVVLSE